jgi:hypothetical protein
VNNAVKQGLLTEKEGARDKKALAKAAEKALETHVINPDTGEDQGPQSGANAARDVKAKLAELLPKPKTTVYPKLGPVAKAATKAIAATFQRDSTTDSRVKELLEAWRFSARGESDASHLYGVVRQIEKSIEQAQRLQRKLEDAATKIKGEQASADNGVGEVVNLASRRG